MVAPEIIDLHYGKDEDPNLRKGLMNIGKAVQSLANHIFFGKELPSSADDEYFQHNANVLTMFLETLQVCKLEKAF